MLTDVQLHRLAPAEKPYKHANTGGGGLAHSRIAQRLATMAHEVSLRPLRTAALRWHLSGNQSGSGPAGRSATSTGSYKVSEKIGSRYKALSERGTTEKMQ